MDFMIGALAGVGAGFFSNPFDVIKTRMQLQGELKAKGQHSVHYKNVAHALYTIAKHDGFLALQKGLVPALWFQFVVNGTRLGIYQQADNFGFLRDSQGHTKFSNSFVMSSISGMIGGYLGSPLQLVKTQLMSYSSHKIAVGTQHKHQGMAYAFKKIYNTNGFWSLFRSGKSMMTRNAVGSASQLATYTCAKEWMDEHGLFSNSHYISAIIASNFGALSKTICMAPLDVIVTRLCNQDVDARGRGVLYTGIIDCARKISKVEGLPAFYKGFVPLYLRQLPHTVLLLVFWEMLKDLRVKYTKL